MLSIAIGGNAKINISDQIVLDVLKGIITTLMNILKLNVGIHSISEN